ncbi:hypothetical protein B0H12DRAFT_1096293 [Mycena haematopus]|nr:hypothetical protein B0H12DRAFT_1096293 [Mycena haematopus]
MVKAGHCNGPQNQHRDPPRRNRQSLPDKAGPRTRTNRCLLRLSLGMHVHLSIL